MCIMYIILAVLSVCMHCALCIPVPTTLPSYPPPPPSHLHLPIPTSSCGSAVLPYYFPHLHTLCFCTFPSPPLLVVLLSCHITSHTSTPCASAPSHPHLFLWFCCPAILLPTPPHPVLLHLPIPTSSCGSAVLPYYFPHLHTLCFCTFPSPPLLVVLLSCHITSHTSTPCASAPSHPHIFLCLLSCHIASHTSTPCASAPFHPPPPPTPAPPSCVCCHAILLPTPPHPVLRPTPFHPHLPSLTNLKAQQFTAHK